ncbi:MAG: hypothetical protein NC338_07250 [Firmicutes bacterium]|nr:hypothetical protein [Bacillota bacterium]MCM1401791.1 hypothetical protein [Bacteroides sp.]MCM1477672.1 hypothetical protein [Bacteroides sp.]
MKSYQNLLRCINAIPVGCASALIFSLILVLTLMPASDVPPVHIPHIDKAVHAIMFGALTVVLVFDSARYRGRVTRGVMLVCALISTLIGGGIELAQDGMGLGRGGDWADLAADAFGAFLFPWMFIRLLNALVAAYCIKLHAVRHSAKVPAAVKNLYESAFPPDERRPWPDVLKMVDHEPDFHLTLLKWGSTMGGFITWWTLGRRVYIEHFAVEPELRSNGFGGMALDVFCANRRGCGVVLEAEPAITGEMALRRIRFYCRHGFEPQTQFRYIQPPYAPGLNPVELVLMTRGNVGSLDAVAAELYSKVYKSPGI